MDLLYVESGLDIHLFIISNCNLQFIIIQKEKKVVAKFLENALLVPSLLVHIKISKSCPLLFYS